MITVWGQYGLIIRMVRVSQEKQPRRILLCDLAPTVLPSMPPDAQQYAREWLERHGVELHLGSPLPRTAVVGSRPCGSSCMDSRIVRIASARLCARVWLRFG